MSANELSRLEIMQRMEEKRLKQKEAAEMLGLTVRQIKRLVRLHCKKSVLTDKVLAQN